MARSCQAAEFDDRDIPPAPINRQMLAETWSSGIRIRR